MHSEAALKVNDSINEAVAKYSGMLFRLCIVILGNQHDAEDALQETFIRYMCKAPAFHDDEHQKAWLIRVATNICKDIRRYTIRSTHYNLDDYSQYCCLEEQTGILESVLKLKPKYKEIIILHYIEGYKVEEISKILGITVSAAKKRLQYARDLLKLEMEE